MASKDLSACKLYHSSLGIGISSTINKGESLFDSECDVLVIPQATLSGKMKGKNLQHHDQVKKEEGREMYTKFIHHLARNLSPPSLLPATSTIWEQKGSPFLLGEGEKQVQYGAKLRDWDPSISIDGLNGFYLSKKADAAKAESSSKGSQCKEEEDEKEKSIGTREGARVLAFGTYGNRQGLHVESDGPYTLFMEW